MSFQAEQQAARQLADLRAVCADAWKECAELCAERDRLRTDAEAAAAGLQEQYVQNRELRGLLNIETEAYESCLAELLEARKRVDEVALERDQIAEQAAALINRKAEVLQERDRLLAVNHSLATELGKLRAETAGA